MESVDMTWCATMQGWAQLKSRQISTQMAQALALTSTSLLNSSKTLPLWAVSLQHTAEAPDPTC